jgi:sugar phosphate isomerase/epimerase
MRFGLCTGPENLETVRRMGFDYIECAVTAIEALEKNEFDALEARAAKNSFPVERFNVLFPGTLRLVGPGADRELIRAYLRRAFPRLRALGGTLAVFGSGQSRAFPPGMPYREGFRQLAEIAGLIGEEAAAQGLSIAIEPLNRGETNSINSLREGAMLEAAAKQGSVGLLADLYHILKEGEPLENIALVGELRHTHVALLEGRAYPAAPHPAVEAFFGALRGISYDGTMSVEGGTKDLEKDGPAALQTLRAYC